MKMNVTIIYTDGILPYCPTVLNLKDLLETNGGFDVKIATFKPDWCKIEGSIPNVKYLHQWEKIHRIIDNRIIFYLFQWLMRVLIKLYHIRMPVRKIRKLTSRRHHIAKAIDLILNKSIDWNGLIIAVDPAAAVAASIRAKQFIFLSLEAYENDLTSALISMRKMRALLIQSAIRKDIVLPNYRGKWFLLPNSPIFANFKIPDRRPGDIVFAGTAWELFGFESILAAIQGRNELRLTHIGFCPDETKMNIQDRYPELIANKQLFLIDRYIPQSEIVREIAKFRIGVCFYRIDLALKCLTLNYMTAPSGKLFNYLAAGVPVVCSDIPAFEFIRKRRCGILVRNLTPESILAAVDLIESNYEEFVQNALSVGEESCFKKHAEPVIEFLKEGYATLTT